MGHQDLRDWIEQVDALGELRRITGARWEDEIGPITELAQHREDGPCVLFDEVPGFPKGYRVAVNSLGALRRASLTLHMEPRRRQQPHPQDGLPWCLPEVPRQRHVQVGGPVLENV